MSRRDVPRIEVILALVLILIATITLGAFAIAGYNNSQALTSAPQQPQTVKVRGTLDTSGWATSPVGIEFKDKSSDAKYSGPVYTQAGSSQRIYEVTVLNSRNYEVTVIWMGVFGWKGTCTGGNMSVAANASMDLTFNAKC